MIFFQLNICEKRLNETTTLVYVIKIDVIGKMLTGLWKLMVDTIAAFFFFSTGNDAWRWSCLQTSVGQTETYVFATKTSLKQEL